MTKEQLIPLIKQCVDNCTIDQVKEIEVLANEILALQTQYPTKEITLDSLSRSIDDISIRLSDVSMKVNYLMMDKPKGSI